jgi:hypothetical protein
MKAPIQEHIVQPHLEKIYVNHFIDSDPDLSWLQNEYEDCTPEERERCKAEDARILRNYNNGLWVAIGIVAHAEISITYNGLKFYHEFKSSIWGVCSFDDEGIKMYQQEQIEHIKDEARDLGIAISQYLEVIIDEDIKN